MLRSTSRCDRRPATKLSSCCIAIVMLAFVVPTGGCSDDQNTLPIHMIATADEERVSLDSNTLPVDVIAATSGERVSLAAKSPTPEIVLTGQHMETHGDNVFVFADLVLVNPLEMPITYYGYQMDSWQTRPKIGEISPFYKLELKDGDDEQWRDGEGPWCGTGVGQMIVRPKEAGRFHARIKMPAHSARIGFACTWPVKGIPTKTELWSPTIVCPEN